VTAVAAIGYTLVEKPKPHRRQSRQRRQLQSTQAGTATLIKSGTGSDTVTVGSGPPVPNRIDASWCVDHRHSGRRDRQ